MVLITVLLELYAQAIYTISINFQQFCCRALVHSRIFRNKSSSIMYPNTALSYGVVLIYYIIDNITSRATNYRLTLIALAVSTT